MWKHCFRQMNIITLGTLPESDDNSGFAPTFLMIKTDAIAEHTVMASVFDRGYSAGLRYTVYNLLSELYYRKLTSVSY